MIRKRPHIPAGEIKRDYMDRKSKRPQNFLFECDFEEKESHDDWERACLENED